MKRNHLERQGGAAGVLDRQNGGTKDTGVTIHYGDSAYDCWDSETVLDAFLRHGVEINHSCRKGLCQGCMMRATSGTVPKAAQAGIEDTLRAEGYFMPCLCRPLGNLTLATPDAARVYGRAAVAAIKRLAPDVTRVTLRPSVPLYYRAGQFIILRRADGLSRAYSLASVPALDKNLDIHVKQTPGGRMSGWIFERMAVGDAIDFHGPSGESFYEPGRAHQPLLLIGTGTGLGPLAAIARDALYAGHRGAIHLYHGSREPEGLYLGREMHALAKHHSNFLFEACLSGGKKRRGCRAGRADLLALENHPDLAGWRVFLSGHPAMVQEAKRAVYRAGVEISDIYADPFEMREKRNSRRADKPQPADVW